MQQRQQQQSEAAKRKEKETSGELAVDLDVSVCEVM